MCVSMRFHACIFALSHGVNTLGIDYGIAQKGKVFDLFDDFGLVDNVINVSDFTASWLSSKILGNVGGGFIRGR